MRDAFDVNDTIITNMAKATSKELGLTPRYF